MIPAILLQSIDELSVNDKLSLNYSHKRATSRLPSWPKIKIYETATWLQQFG